MPGHGLRALEGGDPLRARHRRAPGGRGARREGPRRGGGRLRRRHGADAADPRGDQPARLGLALRPGARRRRVPRRGGFTGPDALAVAGRTLRFARAVIATGARPGHPPIPGLAEAGFLTNETVFELTERPGHLAVVGGGPIGCELAQAFRRLGAEVTLLSDAPQLLPREDQDAAEIVRQALLRDGVRLVLGAEVAGVAREGTRKILRYRESGREDTVAADEILVAAGRVPNVEGLGLEAAGRAPHARGRRRGRPAADDEPPDLRRRRRVPRLEVHPRRRRRRADRRPERALRLAGRRRREPARHAVVHVHGPGGGARRAQRARGARARAGDRHAGAPPRGRGPRAHRRRDGGLRQGARAAGHRPDRRRHHRGPARRRDDQRADAGHGRRGRARPALGA